MAAVKAKAKEANEINDQFSGVGCQQLEAVSSAIEEALKLEWNDCWSAVAEVLDDDDTYELVTLSLIVARSSKDGPCGLAAEALNVAVLNFLDKLVVENDLFKSFTPASRKYEPLEMTWWTPTISHWFPNCWGC